MLWWQLRKLGSPDAADRLHAVEKLRGKKDPEVGRVLERAAREESEPRVREALAEALGAIGEPAFVPTLLQLHAEARRDDLRDVAIAAKAAIVKMGETALPSLSAARGSDDTWVRRSATEIDRKLRQRKRRATRPESYFDADQIADRLARDLTLRLADRPRPERNRDVPLAINDLEQFRKLPQETARKHAALFEEGLGMRSPEIVSEALETLFHAIGAQSLPQLFAALGSGEDRVCWTACALLARLGDSAPWRELVSLLHDPSERTRAGAAQALGVLHRRDIFPSLLNAITDPSPSVRAAVCGALVTCDAQLAIPELIRCLRDQEPFVRVRCVRALGELCAEEAVAARDVFPSLLSAITDPSPDVRAAVCGALVACDARSAIPELVRCLCDQEPSVRIWCVWALGELCAEEAVAALEQLARDDPDTEQKEWTHWRGNLIDDEGVRDVHPIREAATAALEKILRSREEQGVRRKMPPGSRRPPLQH